MIIKRLIVFIFSLTVSSAFAGSMGPSCGTSDTAPCNVSAWNLAGRALYLQPKYANEPWVSEQAMINNITGENGSPVRLRGYGWGFYLEGSYHIGNDRALDANLYYFNAKDKSQTEIPNSGFRDIRQHNEWLAINLEASKVIPVSDGDGIRGFAGFQFASINKERTLNRTVINSRVPGITDIVGANNGNFNGGGPRFGVDLHYNFPCNLVSGFSVYTNAAVEVLIGGSRSRVFAVAQPNALLNGFSDKTVEIAVVPEFDIRAGFNYKYPTVHGDFKLDIGWMWFDYISAIVERIDAESTDVMYQGVYFGLKWLGNFG